MNKISYSVIYLVLVLLIGCTTTPNAYGDYVEVISGLYKGNRGKLVGDCSGFEKYRIKLNQGGHVCVHSWEMEKI